MSDKRQSIQGTYDSRDTGTRYHVTTWIGDHAIAFREPVDDPFVRTTVRVGWPDMLRALIRRRHLVVTVLIDGDRDIVNDVLELNDNTLIPNSTRRDEFNQHLSDVLEMEARNP